MYSPHKHSYLQARSSGIPPRIINRAVHAANINVPIDEYDVEPPFKRLTSEQPCLPLEGIDVTRRPQAFGRLAMPKLCRELHSKDSALVSQAINSIGDLVHDPEKAYEAIALNIPDRMADLLLNEDPNLRERVCMALKTLAGQGDGRDAIVQNKLMLRNLSTLLQDEEPAVRVKTAALVEMLSRAWMAADYLVDCDFIPLILECLPNEENEIKTIHLETLSNLMYCQGKDQALDCGAFNLFVELLEHEEDSVRTGACHCLMLLTSTPSGKKVAFKQNVLFKLTQLLHISNPEVYAAAASAIMFSTIKTKAKIKAAKIAHLPDRLVDLCKDWYNPRAQIFGMKALTNICEHPEVRKYVREKYIEELKNTNISEHPEQKPVKDCLIEIVMRIPSLY